MCGVAAAGLVVGILSAVGTAAQQSDQQRKTVNYQNRVTEVTSANAAKAANADYIAIAEQSAQIQQAAAQERLSALQGKQLAEGRTEAASAAAGVEGRTVDDMRLAIQQKYAEDLAIRNKNLDWQSAQIQRQMDMVGINEQNRLNSRMLPGVPGVDWAALLGGLANASTGYAGLQPGTTAATPSSSPGPTVNNALTVPSQPGSGIAGGGVA